jgi:hypothetical protein
MTIEELFVLSIQLLVWMFAIFCTLLPSDQS